MSFIPGQPRPTMRKVVLKDTKEQGGIRYTELLKVLLLNSLGDRGMVGVEIRKCNKVLDKIESANGAVLLTDEEWEFLHQRAEQFPFRVGGREVETFLNDIRDAERVNVQEAPAATSDADLEAKRLALHMDEKG